MITDFLKTNRSIKDLQTALEVLREFKECESPYHASFESWIKLEQLEEFLSHLVEGTPLEKDTIEYMSRKEEKITSFRVPLEPIKDNLIFNGIVLRYVNKPPNELGALEWTYQDGVAYIGTAAEKRELIIRRGGL